MKPCIDCGEPTGRDVRALRCASCRESHRRETVRAACQRYRDTHREAIHAYNTSDAARKRKAAWMRRKRRAERESDRHFWQTQLPFDEVRQAVLRAVPSVSSLPEADARLYFRSCQSGTITVRLADRLLTSLGREYIMPALLEAVGL